ncbi:carboxylate--amine ligase [Edaphobacter bradus]|uniref:carboxylate--amine ligase n=1 Tax=Edaphobacter bradus TaxID=2259016 RepID=UPI0021E0B6F2|nr:ATP-grasp domain-containing protein [Edaphobacter bradus]
MLNSKLPPALIVGGDHGALSAARSLAAVSIKVYAINHPLADVRYSRFCTWIDLSARTANAPEAWATYLLGRESDHLRGAVLLAASDEAIELIAEHRELLSERFRLDLSNPAAQLCMLDKLGTYRAAQAAGIPTPKFWVADTRKQVEGLEHELVFPLVLKPILGHKFRRKFSGSYTVTYNMKELLNAFDTVCCAGIRTFLVEMIPGPDDKLCSYYTYLDANGNNLIDFTKRVIRRYPMNMGGASYHITDHVPDIQELALALFQKVGLRGVANAEFKMDERDGKLKLIECNARFTAADCLLVASGLNLPLFVYNRLTGRAQAAPSSYRMGMRLWNPVGDFAAYRQLNKMRLLTFKAWIRSIMHRNLFPVFRWSDPLPAIVGSIRLVLYAWSRATSKVGNGNRTAHLRLPSVQQSSQPLTTTIAPDIPRHQEPTIGLSQKQTFDRCRNG